MKTATLAAAVLLIAGVSLSLPAPDAFVRVSRSIEPTTRLSRMNRPCDGTSDQPGALVGGADADALPDADAVPVTPATWSLLKRLYRG